MFIKLNKIVLIHLYPFCANTFQQISLIISEIEAGNDPHLGDCGKHGNVTPHWSNLDKSEG